jgi:hypothetical protein
MANVRGLETSLYGALGLAMLWLGQRHRWLAMGIASALLGAARPDGYLVVVVVAGVLALGFGKGPALRFIVGFASVSAVWFLLLAGLTDGQMFPSTLEAKMAQSRSGYWGGRLAFLRSLWSSALLGGINIRRTGQLVAVTMLVVGVVGIALALRRKTRSWTTITLGLVGFIQLVIYFIVLGVPPYTWYFATLLVAVVAGAAMVMEVLGAHLPRRFHVLIILGVGVLAISLVGSFVKLQPTRDRVAYAAIASWVDADSQKAHPTVACIEIGSIGFHGEADLVDYLGLLDSSASPAVARGDFTGWLDSAPDYWVTQGKWIDSEAFHSRAFIDNYSLAKKIGEWSVYRRRIS